VCVCVCGVNGDAMANILLTAGHKPVLRIHFISAADARFT